MFMTTLWNYPPKWTHVPNIQDVLAQAEIAKSIANSMWWNGSEFNDIDVIVRKVRDGTLDAATAIMQIQSIPEDKHWNGWHWLMW